MKKLKGQTINSNSIKLHIVKFDLDSLTDIFSFFTSFDSSVSRQTCRWWNDLLTKDFLSTNQIKKNFVNETCGIEKKINQSSILGHLEILKWARIQGCDWNAYTCAYAAKGGHLEVLKWSRSQGCDWTVCTCACAAMGGHLEVLKWARAQGCDWNAGTCVRAAEGGHLEVLKWAKTQGCDWNVDTCLRSKNQPNVQSYIHSLDLNISPCNCPRIL
jgi:hypothetical protein